VFDVISAVKAGSELANGIIERIWPNPEEADKRKLEVLKIELESHFNIMSKQLEISIKEAEHPSLFVAGARPFILWICAFGLAYASILEPLARFIAVVFFEYEGDFPQIDTDLTLQILLGMLGLAGMRSHDKRFKVERNKL